MLVHNYISIPTNDPIPDFIFFLECKNIFEKYWFILVKTIHIYH